MSTDLPEVDERVVLAKLLLDFVIGQRELESFAEVIAMAQRKASQVEERINEIRKELREADVRTGFYLVDGALVHVTKCPAGMLYVDHKEVTKLS